ncbi:MAG: hypothetical protein NXI07_00385 [bacterium]|nr:hypothetical protein [bacterium]
MGARFGYLANVCSLPLPDPIVESDTAIFEQKIDKRFRRRSMITAIILITLCIWVMIDTFSYIAGLKPVPPRVSARRYIYLFYICPPVIVYFSWWLTRVLRNKGYTRRICISSKYITLNQRALENPILIRGPVRIRHVKEERPIEAIRVESGRRAFIIAAKDNPDDLDQIESMIPQQVQTNTDEVELKGVL